MGPAQRRAGTTLSILYGILVIILLSQIQPADASPLPKTDIPALEGEANYKRWASLVRNSLIVLGLWYTIDEPAPTPEFEIIVIKPKTETSPGETRLGEQTNSAEIIQWEKDDMKASAYISLFTGPTTAHYVDEYEGTSHSNWHALKKAFGKRGAMATFHTLRAFQQFKFDPNTSFAKQIEQLQLAQVELADFGHKITDNEVAIALLMGLPDSWSNIVAAFLATQPDLFKISAHDVRKRIIDESDRVSGNTGTPLLSSAQRAGSSNSPSTGLTSRGKLRLNRYTCTKCGPGGHTDEFCWTLHPELKRSRNTAKSANTAVFVDPPPVPPDISAALNMMGASSSTLFYSNACSEWMLDSGASDHISPHLSDFVPGSVLNVPGSIRLGNNSTMQYLGIGTIEATTIVNGSPHRITLQRVLYAPDASARFISFMVNVSPRHTSLAEHCLRVLGTLSPDMCKIGDPSIRNQDIDLPGRIANHIPAHVQYACRHWASHLTSSHICNTVLDLLQEFCSNQLLNWLEVMSLLGGLDGAMTALHSACRIANVSCLDLSAA